MSEDSLTTIDCHVSLEYLDSGKGFIAKKVNYKQCTLRLIRNEFRDILLSVMERNKQVLQEELKSIAIHRKFITEGKATIEFKQKNLTLFISNAPSSRLLSFLKLMTVKVINDDGQLLNVKAKLLSSKPHYVEDISPLTEKDYNNAKIKLKANNEIARKGLKRAAGSTEQVKAKKNCLLQILQQPLSDEQKLVLQAAKDGHNVFFTGSAGTGKSHVLKSIIAAFPPDVTFATASTAMAACQIGGTTLHQFAGIGKGDGSLEHCIALASRRNVEVIWKKCKHLIIDEISMVDGTFFEKLECIARKIRNNDKPFGGIQLILCGDFFQLPPISKTPLFCFQTKAWTKCITKMFELGEIHRQSDPVLINILQNIRLGNVTQDVKNHLEKTALQTIEKNGILATRLCTHTAESEEINKSKLEELLGDAKSFKAVDTPDCMSSLIDRQCRVASKVTLKVGAQVMLLQNVDIARGLVNGARGVVLKFDSDKLPVVRFESGVHTVRPGKFTMKNCSGALLTRVQIPLTLAWAFSIHKSQGLTLDCVELSLSRVFEAGHTYVALSRAKDLRSLRVLDFNAKQVWANGEVLKFYEKFKRRITSESSEFG